MTPWLAQADDLPQLIAILVVIGISTLVNLLRNRSKKEDGEITVEEIPPELLEQMRRGTPPTARPAEPEAPRYTAPKRTPKPKPKPTAKDKSRPAAKDKKRRRVETSEEPTPTAAARAARSQRMRRRRRKLRQAVLWSEILQPPVALREDAL